MENPYLNTHFMIRMKKDEKWNTFNKMRYDWQEEIVKRHEWAQNVSG